MKKPGPRDAGPGRFDAKRGSVPRYSVGIGVTVTRNFGFSK